MVGIFLLMLYKDRNNTVIAEKKIVFKKSTIAPEYSFKDKRNGQLEKVRTSGDMIDIQYRENTNSALEKVSIPRTNNMVIDGGFDYFVRMNWDIILKTSSIFSFVSTSRKTTFSFSIQFTGKEQFNDLLCAKFIMRPGNPILKFLVKPIILHYSWENKRLISYQGLSNIADSKQDKNYSVRILFNYPK